MGLPLPKQNIVVEVPCASLAEKSREDHDPELLALPTFLKRDYLWIDAGTQSRIQMEFVVDNSSLAGLANGVLPINCILYAAHS